eukprot:464991-Pyramimonas_sp.AAC.1
MAPARIVEVIDFLFGAHGSLTRLALSGAETDTKNTIFSLCGLEKALEQNVDVILKSSGQNLPEGHLFQRTNTEEGARWMGDLREVGLQARR